jgi:hypothetical protein
VQLKRIQKIKEDLSEIGKMSLVLCYSENSETSQSAQKINQLTQNIYKHIDREDNLVRFVEEEEQKIKEKYPDYSPNDSVSQGAKNYASWLETGNHPASNKNPNLQWGNYHL